MALTAAEQAAATRLQNIYNEIKTDPQGLGYSAFIPDQGGHIVNLINDKTQKMVQSRFITDRTVMAELTDGFTILDKLDAAGTQDSRISRAMKFMGQDGGLDIGHPTTQGMINQLATAGVLLQTEADELNAMAQQPASRAEVLGFGYVSELDIINSGALK